MIHTIIKDSSLNGWEYGMLRSFENAIREKTNAVVEIIPEYLFAKKYLQHFSLGMKRGKYREYFPKQSWAPSGDIGWYILMGPENYKLDLFKKWDKGFRTRILYFFDTFPSQYPLIKRICCDGTWDVLITSFNDAVDDLQRLTGRQWHCIEQAADPSLFTGKAFEERIIHFSSYGRRYTVLHEVVKEFCERKGLYYDYTTHDGRHPVVDSSELYRQYAWHLNHSLFTFSWPVELTNPSRSGHLHPITCRWFEAMASGTIILGRKPANDIFKQWLDEDIVMDLDPTAGEQSLLHRLGELWDNREQFYEHAQIRKRKKEQAIFWNERVRSILSIVNL